MAILAECSRIDMILEKTTMIDGTKVNTKGGGGKRGGGRMNIFFNNNQPINNANYHTRNIEELETATYIVSQFSLPNIYAKVNKEIIRYVIIKLHGGVHLMQKMWITG